MSHQDTFKALSDNTRRQILRYLKEGDMSAGEIAEKFNMSKPSISHHLTLLKQADLVSDRRQGQSIIYSLNTSVFEELLGVIMEFIRKTPGEDEDRNNIKRS
nr:autorepressor SdpR family transcription factor [Desulfosporosinus youngiae]